MASLKYEQNSCFRFKRFHYIALILFFIISLFMFVYLWNVYIALSYKRENYDKPDNDHIREVVSLQEIPKDI